VDAQGGDVLITPSTAAHIHCLARGEILGYRQRPHHETWLKRDKGAGGPPYELTNRDMALLFVDLVHDQRHFSPDWRNDTNGSDPNSKRQLRSASKP
jgi:hypothetical protein